MPNDLDKIFSLESCRKINVNDFVRQANKTLKQALLSSQLQTLDQTIKLTTTTTRNGGTRFWFACPGCRRKVGVLYENYTTCELSCRLCQGFIYDKQK